MKELIRKIDEFLSDYDSLEEFDYEDNINFLSDAVDLLNEAKEALSKNSSKVSVTEEPQQVTEVGKIVVSRSLLEEYGYDGNMPTNEQLETIADELLQYWQVSDGFEDALRHTMKEMFNIEL